MHYKVLVLLLVFSTYSYAKRTLIVEELSTHLLNLIEKYGYKTKAYNVTSEDGYIIQIFRVKTKNNLSCVNTTYDSGYPIILHPGFATDAAGFVLLGPEQALALRLADMCQDVWIINPRGTRYSMRHNNPALDRREYWNFGMEEQGIYDVAAVIDYILRITAKMKVKFIGISQGCASVAILLSEKPYYNDKFDRFIAIAPMCFLSNAKSLNIPLKLMEHIDMVYLSLILRRSIGDFNIIPSGNWSLLVNFFCAEDNPMQELCILPFSFFVDYRRERINRALFPAILYHWPTSGSSKVLLHYLQLSQTEKFQKFDYGNVENFNVYGKSAPPEYNLTNLQVPTFVYYAKNDVMLNYRDAIRFAQAIPDCKEIHKIPDENWTHMDFLFGTNVSGLVYDSIIDDLWKPFQ